LLDGKIVQMNRLISTILILLIALAIGPGYSITGHSQAIGTIAQEKKILETEDLNDQDRFFSQNFIHDGLSNRQLLEECGKNEQLKKACANQDPGGEFLGMEPEMVQALSKAYALVASFGGGDFELSEEAAKEVQPGDKKTKSDYCKYIPVGTEAVAQFQETSIQDTLNNLPANRETVQKDQLYKASRSHFERAKTSKMQTIGWGATTACYGYMMTQPIKKDWKVFAKLGGAGLLTLFFKGQATDQEKFGKKVKDIADRLPGKGDCNPITQRDCYCVQPETENDQQFCLPEILKRRKVAAGNVQVSCINNELKADPSCKCLQENSCFDQEFLTNINGLNFGTFDQNSIKPLTSLSRGQLLGGDINSGALGRQLALAKRALKKAEDSLEDTSLSPKLQKEAKALQSLGVPPKLAKKIASQPISGDSKKAALKFQKGFSGRTAKAKKRRSRNKVLRFRGGKGINAKTTQKRSGFNPLKGLKKRKGRSVSGRVLSYAEKATKAAQINKAKDRPIFEIISRAYQVTGRRRLQLNP
jgi:hypothetical protein